LKKEHGSIILGGAMVTREVCSMYLQHYIRVIYLVKKGERLFRGRSKALKQGEQPQGKFRGSNPKRRMALCH
jgi:hypothetical protein